MEEFDPLLQGSARAHGHLCPGNRKAADSTAQTTENRLTASASAKESDHVSVPAKPPAARRHDQDKG
jgi:hypothetical protein